MQTSSQVFHKNQTVIPDSVLHALNLRDGDAIVFEIDQTGVHLRKVLPVDTVFPSALQGTGRWMSGVLQLMMKRMQTFEKFSVVVVPLPIYR